MWIRRKILLGDTKWIAKERTGVNWVVQSQLEWEPRLEVLNVDRIRKVYTPLDRLYRDVATGVRRNMDYGELLVAVFHEQGDRAGFQGLLVQTVIS